MGGDLGSPRSIEALIAQAQSGSDVALGELLEHFRRYLLRIAGAELDADLRAKAGPSDVVQETCLEAQRIFARFDGDSQAELQAWLRAILLNKLATFQRQYRGTLKREVAREARLPSDVGSPPTAGRTPSTPSMHVMRHERAEAVAAALDALPEHYRQVIVWRQWENLPFEEVARRLGRSIDATRMVWWRAIERLGQRLESLQ